MNFFKLGRGDFFGTIIPGTFLLINLAFLFRKQLTALLEEGGTALGTGNANATIQALPNINSAILLPIIFVVSYVLGFALRVIRPSRAEDLALPLRIPIEVPLFTLKIYLKRRNNEDRRSLTEIFKEQLRWAKGPFRTQGRSHL